MKIEIKNGENAHLIEVKKDARNALIDGKSHQYEMEALGQGRYLLRVDGKTHIISNPYVENGRVEFTIDGKSASFDIKDEQAMLLDSLGFKTGESKGQGTLKSPMPGKIVNVLVNMGDEVSAGDPVIILEAMKMENELKAPIGGKITGINVEIGKSVEKNAALLEIANIG